MTPTSIDLRFWKRTFWSHCYWHTCTQTAFGAKTLRQPSMTSFYIHGEWKTSIESRSRSENSENQQTGKPFLLDLSGTLLLHTNYQACFCYPRNIIVSQIPTFGGKDLVVSTTLHDLFPMELDLNKPLRIKIESTCNKDAIFAVTAWQRGRSCANNPSNWKIKQTSKNLDNRQFIFTVTNTHLHTKHQFFCPIPGATYDDIFFVSAILVPRSGYFKV